MGMDEANGFLKLLRDDSALFEEVLGCGETRSERIDAMVEVAAHRGLVFSDVEMRKAFAERGLTDERAELSPAELEAVAGGVDGVSLRWMEAIWSRLRVGRSYIGETEKNLASGLGLHIEPK